MSLPFRNCRLLWGVDVLHKVSKIRSAYWYSSLSVIWLLIIALQWIRFGDGIWYKETSALMLATLGIVAVLEILLPKYHKWRWFIKTVGIVISWRMIMVAYGIYVPIEGSFLKEQLPAIVTTFAPYFWFVISAWAIFEILLRFMHTVRNVLFVLGVSLIGLCISDSFSTFYLWTHVAWTVFAGLGWLVCLNFRQFQLKFPEGWGQLRRQPIRILFDIIFILACVLIISINMPEVSPTLTDPYTAWVNRNGTSTVTGGTGDSSGTSSEGTGQSQSVTSGYGRDDSVLGGSFDFSYESVMQVDTPVKSYWRGETRLTYSGQGWIDIEDNPDSIPYSGGQLLHASKASKVETREVEQIFTMQSDRKYPVLFGAYEMSEVNLQDDREGIAQMLWNSQDAQLYWHGYSGDQRQIDYPHTYKVVSEIPVIPVAELAKQSYERLYPSAVPSQYLQLPSDLPNRVTALAEEISRNGTTPYEKVTLMTDYLRQNYRYNNRPNLALKQSDDFVESFLFEIKEGYCDYFSTALIVMARSQGIPARWVKGFAPGMLSNAGVRDGETKTLYQVSNADAHSWVEVYFGEEYGWVSFEATPGFTSPELTATENNQDQQQEPEEEQEQQVEQEQKPQSNSEQSTWLNSTMVKIIAVTAIAIIILWVILRFRESIYYAFLGMRKGHALSFGDKTVHDVMTMVKRLKRKGYEWNESQTLREAFDAWIKVSPIAEQKLMLILQKFEKANYSPERITEQEWKLIQSLVSQVVKEMKPVS